MKEHIKWNYVGVEIEQLRGSDSVKEQFISKHIF